MFGGERLAESHQVAVRATNGFSEEYNVVRITVDGIELVHQALKVATALARLDGLRVLGQGILPSSRLKGIEP